MTTNFFSPLSFVAVFGSGIRDPGWVKIRIRDKHSGSATLPYRFLVKLEVYITTSYLRDSEITNLRKIDFSVVHHLQHEKNLVLDPIHYIGTDLKFQYW
jgi:hypothetical protein